VADGPDGEYTVGAVMPLLGHVPLFNSKRHLVDAMRPLAEEHRKRTGHKVRLIEFERKRELYFV